MKKFTKFPQIYCLWRLTSNLIFTPSLTLTWSSKLNIISANAVIVTKRSKIRPHACYVEKPCAGSKFKMVLAKVTPGKCPISKRAFYHITRDYMRDLHRYSSKPALDVYWWFIMARQLSLIHLIETSMGSLQTQMLKDGMRSILTLKAVGKMWWKT
jgi:hypothetical protein